MARPLQQLQSAALPDSDDADAACGSAPAGASLLSVLRAAADPLRLQVLRLLARDAWNVAELCQMLQVTQPALSHHLKILADAGLIISRKDGRSAYYRRTLLDPEARCHATLTALLTDLDDQALDTATEQRRDAVFEARARASEAFFTRHAQAFRASQDLIAEPDQYLQVIGTMLPEHMNNALELGPGDGTFLPQLAAHATRVVAVDTSPEMIAAARRRCAAAGADNVTLLSGELPDLQHEASLAQPFDLIILAMVLHHSPRPEALLADCARRLTPGGQLLIAELCPHDQDWVREACGDVWQGFAPEELARWAAAAGLQDSASQYLAQRNGFRLQVRAFSRASLTTPGARA